MDGNIGQELQVLVEVVPGLAVLVSLEELHDGHLLLLVSNEDLLVLRTEMYYTEVLSAEELLLCQILVYSNRLLPTETEEPKKLDVSRARIVSYCPLLLVALVESLDVLGDVVFRKLMKNCCMVMC